METRLEYYFNHYEDNEIFKKIAKGVKNVWELQDNKKKYIEEEIVGKNKTENNGEAKGNNITFSGNYIIGEGTKIYNNATIEGPVYIGKNCEVKEGSYIRPGTIIGDNCVVGFNSEVKASIIQNGAKIASLAFVGDSILGKSARIGSGVITANRRFDQKNIEVKVDNGKKLDVGSSFFGCIVGDSARIGANSAVYPGTFIGPYTHIFPLTPVRGFIPKEKRVYVKNELTLDENEKMELKA